METGRTTQPWAIGWAHAILAGVYLLLAACAQWAAQHTGVPLSACRFRLLVGLPCPTCGATRAALALLTGHIADAWRFNPLLTCAYLLAPPWLAMRCLGWRLTPWRLSTLVRWLLLAALAAAAGANWAYLIMSGV